MGSIPYRVAIADSNGDGKLDLVTANYSNFTVSVLLGNGDSTFQSRVDYSTGIDRLSVAAANSMEMANQTWSPRTMFLSTKAR